MRVRTVALFFLFLVFLHADHINWLGDYSKALLRAKNKNKPLMVLLVERNCTECNMVISKIFMNQPYIRRLNKRVVSVIVTKDSTIPYPIELLYSTHFPTLFFIDSKSEIFVNEPFYGLITKEEIEKIIKKL